MKADPLESAGYSAARILISKDGQIDITTTATEGEAQPAPSALVGPGKDKQNAPVRDGELQD